MQVHKLLLIFDTRATEIFTQDRNGPFAGSMTFTPGGVELCHAVMEHLKTEYQFAMARLSAEQAILKIGSALPVSEGWTMEVEGRNLNTGLPQRREISTDMIQEPINQILNPIIQTIVREIAFRISVKQPDAFDNEIMLSGEYCELKGLKKRLGDAIRAEAMLDAHIVVVPRKYP
jgi:actin-like ATPase involved in cell morphogenesis